MLTQPAAMELRELAERILFATSLEEKLQWPDVLTDEQPGPGRTAPKMPGRPPELAFKTAGADASDAPSIHHLESETVRGRLLHFFANHELLATELMALVLLRFPDTPPAFRRGVAQTLRDEQEHTRLYIERMRACGVAFGEQPVSGFFWNAVSSMGSPMDYVAGLSLTFEQANLDFSRHFARGFAAVGDAASAALLERIHHDEIGHVAYGLKWFRRWKEPGRSDWEAFCHQLKFPLSPRRARGFSLNVEGRKAAGLDDQFIAELEVYAHSKGRTPVVFLFNPFAEGYLAVGDGFTPVKAQAQLARDLEALPQFLAREDDVVLVRRRPATAFLASLKQQGFALPEFVELASNGTPGATSPLRHRKLGGLRPWAWGPDSERLLKPLAPLAAGAGSPIPYSPAFASLYSKAWSAALLADFLEDCRSSGFASPGSTPWLCPPEVVGRTAATPDEALAEIARIRGRGHHRVVVKAEFGLAGQNAIRLWEPEVLETQRRWIADTLARGHRVVVEPWLERVVDFSIQLEMSPAGLRLCGYTGLVNDLRGQFQSNSAAPHFARHLPAEVTRLLGTRTPADGNLLPLFERLYRFLEPRLRRCGFAGPVGIDAFVYCTGDSRHLLKPVVEINPRYTMGRLTLELMRQVCPGSHGTFRLINRAQLKSVGCGDFVQLAGMLQRDRPVVLEGEPVPRIRSGTICLNDPARAEAVLAVFEVSAR